MAGNSQRKGATRKGSSRKGPTVGSGGQKVKGLKGRGPTPKASQRAKHPAARRAKAAAKRTGSNPRSSRSSSGPSKPRSGGPEYVVGRNAVFEALSGGVPATALYIAERMNNDERVKESVRQAVDRGVSVLEAPRLELDRLADGLPHQGVILAVPEYEYAHADDLLARAHDADEPPLVVVLDHVTDPRNLGAVVRSAAAFGAHGVLTASRRSAGMSAAAWKTSSGAAARIPIARTPNVSRQLAAYRKAGLLVVGLAADGDLALTDVDASGPLALVVGAEGAGLSRLVREGCDAIASIPMADDSESLNAGVAAGIALYALRQNRV
jgi:23S rRNA (guanosine2251-2'-O)-methyltransferase